MKNLWGHIKNDKKFKFYCAFINLYWNTALLIHLEIVFGCFPAIMGKLNSHNGHKPVNPKT